ncbi:MAG: HIT family protein [Alcanivorax sp.]|jgi:diadenosine tetraphosphate (Ap4A) HIT family hydrolase|uniref:HIT domain-containing protein n=1 Tax=Alcanivorax sp. TaxID=1872427 RepID=UPI00199A921C|nr:HIT family protein [Alcanivorax sp.]MBD3642904.1 HIT domain-containing protein [Alcanivorax sp.]MDF1725685.1 HIT family protein [Alcanivorax sp.]
MATLHPRLAADTRALGETELCWLRWMNDRRFPWLIVVPKRDGLREWHHLSLAEQQALLLQVNGLAAELERVTGADKINIGALGNLVPQLHIHIIARFEADACWPGPVWGQGLPEPWAEEERPVWLEALTLPESL